MSVDMRDSASDVTTSIQAALPLDDDEFSYLIAQSNLSSSQGIVADGEEGWSFISSLSDPTGPWSPIAYLEAVGTF